MVFPKSLSKPLKIIAFIVLFVLSLTKKDKCFFVSPTHFGFIILTFDLPQTSSVLTKFFKSGSTTLIKANIYGLTKLGAKVRVCGPPHLIQKNIEELGISVTYDVDELLEWADAVNVLRIQRERMGIGIIPSIREYRNFFGITSDRLKNHKKEIVIMHPGPINRGVEIDSAVADSDNAIILDQVLNGVAVRMSVLYLLLGNNELEK